MVTFDNKGHMVVRSNYKVDASEWLMRMQSLTDILTVAELHEGNKGNVYYLMNMLQDMLPEPEQLELIKKNVP
jgi:hypothetical protein